MIAKFILDKKREAQELTTDEIKDFINGFVDGSVKDYQMSALAMAICCRGMTERETNDLTDAMMRSGRSLSWGELTTADKHSTGGVGDKLSLIIQPLASACGLAVPSLTGRGLGITGGTADKLETIPGYNASLSLDDFQKIVRDIGVSMTVQTDEITPADKKIYALRDVTGTIASIPLIVSSILSKKLAEGAETLVFDVKCGSGAFMKTQEDAEELARALVNGAKAAGRRAAALVSDMSTPLGREVGNVNEVAEAIAILSGEVSPERRDVALSIELASLMVSLAKEMPIKEAREMCYEKLANGEALKKFEAMVRAHGGNLEKFQSVCASPVSRFKIQAMKSGYVVAIDAEKVARVALAIGAGRQKAGDKIDPLAGVSLELQVGDRVSLGAPLATLTCSRDRDVDRLSQHATDLLDAFTISSDKQESRDIILTRVED